MNTMRPVIAGVLLAGVACLMLLGIPQAAEAAPLVSCPTFGCPGGPDQCMSASVTVKGGITIAITCYIKAVQIPA